MAYVAVGFLLLIAYAVGYTFGYEKGLDAVASPDLEDDAWEDCIGSDLS